MTHDEVAFSVRHRRESLNAACLKLAELLAAGSHHDNQLRFCRALGDELRVWTARLAAGRNETEADSIEWNYRCKLAAEKMARDLA